MRTKVSFVLVISAFVSCVSMGDEGSSVTNKTKRAKIDSASEISEVQSARVLEEVSPIYSDSVINPIQPVRQSAQGIYASPELAKGDVSVAQQESKSIQEAAKEMDIKSSDALAVVDVTASGYVEYSPLEAQRIMLDSEERALVSSVMNQYSVADRITEVSTDKLTDSSTDKLTEVSEEGRDYQDRAIQVADLLVSLQKSEKLSETGNALGDISISSLNSVSMNRKVDAAISLAISGGVSLGNSGNYAKALSSLDPRFDTVKPGMFTQAWAIKIKAMNLERQGKDVSKLVQLYWKLIAKSVCEDVEDELLKEEEERVFKNVPNGNIEAYGDPRNSKK